MRRELCLHVDLSRLSDSRAEIEGQLEDIFQTLLCVWDIWHLFLLICTKEVAGGRTLHFCEAPRQCWSCWTPLGVVARGFSVTWLHLNWRIYENRGCFCAFSPVCKGAKADIVFLTDASWSIGDDNFNKVVKFIFNTVGAFDEISPAGIQVSVVSSCYFLQTFFFF